jgi:5'-methylthioinosine phosphorylase
VLKIGIIGGSGFTHFDELKVQKKLNCSTCGGAPAAPLVLGSVSGVEVVFMARHGEAHEIPPHKVNYRANIAALCEQQVSVVFAVNVVGGINMEMCSGDLVIPDQIIDYTWGREHSYSDGPGTVLQHVDFTDPYDQNLRDILLRQAIALGLPVHAGGVYGVTQGPRLETAAEITKMAQDGCDIVGMTGMPEAVLAREQEVPYASLALVVNMAAGLCDQELTMENIRKVIDMRMVDVRKLLIGAVKEYASA